MSKKLNELLIKAYRRWLDEPDPPVPVDTIREYLELEGVPLDNNHDRG